MDENRFPINICALKFDCPEIDHPTLGNKNDYISWIFNILQKAETDLSNCSIEFCSKLGENLNLWEFHT